MISLKLYCLFIYKSRLHTKPPWYPSDGMQPKNNTHVKLSFNCICSRCCMNSCCLWGGRFATASIFVFFLVLCDEFSVVLMFLFLPLSLFVCLLIDSVPPPSHSTSPFFRTREVLSTFFSKFSTLGQMDRLSCFTYSYKRTDYHTLHTPTNVQVRVRVLHPNRYRFVFHVPSAVGSVVYFEYECDSCQMSFNH